MSIVHIYNKERDITYVYESHSYWDKDKKQPRATRKLIGKLDPVTNEVIPTGKRGRPKKSNKTDESSTHEDSQYKELYESAALSLKKKDERISDLENRIANAEQEIRKYKAALSRISKNLSQSVDAIKDCLQ